jgi:ABC-type antimicrobial peptide transport system permease subunit
MALGATPKGVLRLIVSEGMTVVLIGIGIGIVAGLALGRTVSSQMFGVHWWHPATFLGVSVALAVVALAACAIPALRASRVNPIVALRYE